MLNSFEGKAILHPIKRLLFSRKVILSVLGILTAIASGASLNEVLDLVQALVMLVVGLNTAEDVAEKLRG